MMQKNWIWLNQNNNRDEYVDFLDVFLAETGKKYLLDISVSGDYIVYVNGEKVSYGQYRDYEHYKVKDTLDITKYVKAGENRLCICAWHMGA